MSVVCLWLFFFFFFTELYLWPHFPEGVVHSVLKYFTHQGKHCEVGMKHVKEAYRRPILIAYYMQE